MHTTQQIDVMMNLRRNQHLTFPILVPMFIHNRVCIPVQTSLHLSSHSREQSFPRSPLHTQTLEKGVAVHPPTKNTTKLTDLFMSKLVATYSKATVPELSQHKLLKRIGHMSVIITVNLGSAFNVCVSLFFFNLFFSDFILQK